MSPTEAVMVDELNNELREVAGDYRFLEALRAEVRHTSRVMGSYIASKMAQHGGGGGGGGAHAAHCGGGGGGGDDGGAQLESRGLREWRESRESGAEEAAAGDGGEPEQQPQQQQLLPPAPKPFPFVVPIVAKSSVLLFDEANRCTRVRRAQAAPAQPDFWDGRARGVGRGRGLGATWECVQGRRTGPPAFGHVWWGGVAGSFGLQQVRVREQAIVCAACSGRPRPAAQGRLRRSTPLIVPHVPSSPPPARLPPPQGLSSLREVQALCASTFSFGPQIQDGFSPFRTR